MATVEAIPTTRVHIQMWLDQPEAEWLKAYLQNVPEQDRNNPVAVEVATKLFHSLAKVFPRS